MKKTQITMIAVIAVVLAVLGGIALAQQDKYRESARWARVL